MAGITDIQSLLKEIYEPSMAEVFTMGTTLMNEFMKCPKIEANTRAVVFNLETAPGGDAKVMNFDGGTYPLGNSMYTVKPTVSSIGFTQGWNITQLVDWATKNTKLAVAPVLEKQVNDALDAFKMTFDQYLNAASNDGVLDITLANTAGSTYTFDTTDSPYGGYLLTPGMLYDFYDSTLVTKRADGPYRIDPNGGLDLTSNPATVTTTAAVTGWTTLDRIVVRDGVNSGLNPIWYFLNGTASGTCQGLSRSLIYARSQRVDGGNQPFNGPMARTLLNQILKFSGDKQATNNLRPYMPYEQQQNYENSGLMVAEIILGGMSANAVNTGYDMLLGEGKIAGRPMLIGNHCDPTKVGFVNMDQFRWVVTQEIGMLKNPAGGYFFMPMDATTGTLVASQSFYINYMCQLACVDVTKQGVIDTLSLP